MGIQLEGGSIITVRRIKEIDRQFLVGIRRGLFKAGHILTKTLKNEILRGTKSGRIYKIRRGRRTVNHRASAPGETPANRTGALRKSAGFQIHGTEKLEFGYREGSADYSPFLETGTSRMAPRPGLKNAIRAESGNIRNELQNEIGKALS